jgi:hypothetical protein
LFRDASLLEICRLPILFPLLVLLRFVPMLLGLVLAFEPARFVPVAPVLLGRPAALEPVRSVAVVLRLLALGCCLVLDPCCCRAFACRVDMESPRAVPPY